MPRVNTILRNNVVKLVKVSRDKYKLVYLYIFASVFWEKKKFSTICCLFRKSTPSTFTQEQLSLLGLENMPTAFLKRGKTPTK